VQAGFVVGVLAGVAQRLMQRWLAAGEALEAFALAFYLPKAVVLAAPAHCAGFIADFQRGAVEVCAEPENIALCAAVKFRQGIAGMNFPDSESASNYAFRQ